MTVESKNNTKMYSRKFDPDTIEGEINHRFTQQMRRSVAIALIIFFAGLALFSLTAFLPDANGNIDWSLLEGMASLLSLAVAGGGVVFLLHEYAGSETQQTLESASACFNIYKDLFDRVMNNEEMAARRWILQFVPELPPNEPPTAVQFQVFIDLIRDPSVGEIDGTPIGQAHVKRVLNTIDFIGFVDEHYWNMEDDLRDWLGGPVVNVWRRLRPYIEYQAEARSEKETYYRSARMFGDSCLRLWASRPQKPIDVTKAI